MGAIYQGSRGLFKRLMCIALLSTALTTTPAKAYGEELVMDWRFYRRLAMCETGAKVDHSTPSYTSMFGIARGTWQAWSNRSSAAGLTALEQARVVDNIAFEGHWSRGVYKAPVGPWGWGVVKSNCRGLQELICQSRHRLVQRWKRNCK